MRRGITVWALCGGVDGTRSLLEAAPLVQSLGFDGLEASLGQDGELSPRTTPAELRQLRAGLVSRGAVVSSISTLLLDRCSLTAAGPRQRRRARELGLAMLEAAAALGAPTISLSPGRVSAEVDDATARARALEQVAALGRRGRQLGVRVALENVWHGMLLSPAEMAAFIDELDDDHVGACLDVGNCTLNGYPQHWVRALGQRIVKLHVTDTRRRRGMLMQFVQPGAGDVDWAATTAALREVGYQGWATVEAFDDGRVPENQRVRQLAAALDGVLAAAAGEERDERTR